MASSVGQAAHDAVASLLQQTSQLSQQSPPATGNGGVDSLTCQWAHCGERCSSPEALYEHVCERHVGRKSTNNLNLQCQWGTCRTTTVKRDHITSHIRVHVPLKPHKCDFCGKSFKRPQDLKKHVKTHADDSVLLRSPDPNSAAAAAHRGPGANNGFQQNASKGYYPDPSGQGHSQAPPYGYHAGGQQHFGGMQGQGGNGAGYGPVYYPHPTQVGYADGGQLTESRKRGHDALNDFFSQIKRRGVDPAQYMDLGNRIGGVQSMPIPMAMGAYQNSYNHMGGMESDYGAGTAAMYHPAAVPQFQYSLPFTELKTKNDLLSIDSFLEQLQHTVYEQPAPGAAASGMNAIHPSLQNATGREGDSPQHLPSISSHAGSTTDDAASTPGLTPGSFSHSPRSAHSSSAAPSTRTSLYPQLPSVSAMTDPQSSGYGNQTGAPPSSLGNNFEDFDGRRRYSGGYLQRARQSPKGDVESPSSEHGAADRDNLKAAPKEQGKLPGIQALTRRGSDGSADQRESEWLDNMRIIETLRTYLATRLQKGQFEGGEGEADMAGEEGDRESTPRPGPREGEHDQDGDVKMGMTDREREAGSLYPVLKAVEGN